MRSTRARGRAGRARAGRRARASARRCCWEAGVEDARARGYRVLVHRSVEAEAGFAFAGLSDLVAPVFDEVAGELAAPRRAALEVALLLARAPATRRRSRMPSGSRCSTCCASSRSDAPVLVALDDLQWLDASSAVGAARRAATTRARARRAAGDARRGTPGAALGADGAAACGRSSRSGSSGVARRCCVSDSASSSRGRSSRACTQLSGGNPFFALELARCTGRQRAGEPARPARRPRRRAARRDQRTCCCWPPRSRGRRRRWSAPRTASPTAARAALEAAGDVLVARRRAPALRASAARVALLRPRAAVAPPRRAPAARRRRRRPSRSAPATSRSRPPSPTRRWPPSSTPPAPMRRSRAAVAAAELAELAADRTPPADAGGLRRQTPARRRAAALARGRSGPRFGDPRGARRDHAARPRSGRTCCTSWPLSGGQPIAERARPVRAGRRGGRRRRRAGDRASWPGSRIYRWFAGEMQAGLAPRPRGRCAGPSASATLGCSSSPSGRRWATSRRCALDDHARPPRAGAVAAEATLDLPLPFFQSPTLAARRADRVQRRLRRRDGRSSRST